ncbi:MAG: hypothetical protein CMA02_02445 [Euryarchaeota archaeon]|nr:hypothetical protein [Euryarchaeota archaeon]
MNDLLRGIEGLYTIGINMKRGSLVLTVLFIFLVSMVPIQEVSAAQATVHQGPVEHIMFFIGDADDSNTGLMSPSESSKNQLYELEITYQGVEKQRMAQFESVIGINGIIPSDSWDVCTDYRAEGGSTGAANFSVEVEVGGETFTASQGGHAGIPFQPGREGTFCIEVEVDEISVSRGEKITVTLFNNGGVIWTNPDDDSRALIMWGDADSNSGLSLNSPLLDIEMMEPNVDGNQVYFPVRFHSEFGDELAIAGTLTAKVLGNEIGGDPYVSTTSTGVEVVYIWTTPSDAESGSYTFNITLRPQEGVIIQAELSHELTLDGSSDGGEGWYPSNEPVRTGGSSIHVQIDVNQVNDRLERTSSLEIEGAVATWLRWGLDNIGNESLDTTSWWRELSSSGGIIGAEGLNNRQVDDAELELLINHLTSSGRDLADFLDRGLALESKAILGGDPFDLEGALDIQIDLQNKVSFGPEPISIKIRSSTVLEPGSFVFIESFVRSQSKTYWTEVSLDASLSTNPLQGISNVYSEEIDADHLRLGIAENVRVSFTSDERMDDFRVTITPATSFIDGPLTGIFLVFIIMLLSGTVSIRGTRNRSRAPSIFWLLLSMVILSILYIIGIRMSIVLGAGIGTFAMALIIIFISPKHRIDGLDDIPDRKIPVIDCPICKQTNPISSDERPLRLPCGGCGRTLLIE